MGSPILPQQSSDTSDHHNSTENSSSPGPPLPAAPDPSADKGVIPTLQPSLPEDDIIPDNLDIFVLSPVAALKMLCRSIDILVKFTGDVPPTPPVRSRHQSPVRYNGAEEGKENSAPERSHSGDNIDAAPFAKTPIGSPEAHHSEPTTIVGAHAEPIYVQHGAIARKFYSKRPPPISTEEYLMRMHRYCPMSTAVYLATSSYITRLAIVDRVVPVTPRNVHRLLLAGLRVAMKALEDLNWPHGRFSKVGGVSEVELGRLEITFCFLMNFELKVDAEMLQKEAESLKSAILQEMPIGMGMRIPSKGEKRKASSTLPTRPHIPMEVQASS